MAIYEKTTPTTTNEDDIGRSVEFYEAKDTAGTIVRRCRIKVPGAETYDGQVADAFSAADRTALQGILGRGVRKVITDQGFVVKP